MVRREDQLFGHIALHYKVVTKDQLVEALQQQSREGGGRKLGAILVEQGILTPDQMARMLQVQRQLVAQQQGPEASTPQPQAAAPPPPPPPPAVPAPRSPSQPGGPAAGESSARTPPPASEAIRIEALRVPGLPNVKDILRVAVDRGASDIHLHSGQRLRLRINGDLIEDADMCLSADDIHELVASLLTRSQQGVLEKSGQVDLAYTVSDLARFRVNAYRQRDGTDAVFRVIPLAPPTLSDLGLPLDLARFANFHQGLVVLTGPAGCGKSSTLAALVNLVNEERRSHIITIEDPIEYLHPPRRCVVNQRQVEHHTRSFARALRAAMREDPDVIVIGELRDLETISLALTAAETGHLVLGTLHTTNAIATINRLVGAFPPSQVAQIRTMVSESLRGVIAQRLVKKRDGQGRVAALEVLYCTKAASNLIRENKTFQIRSLLQTGASQGMQLLDHSLRDLVTSRMVTREDALRHCEDPRTIPAQ